MQIQSAMIVVPLLATVLVNPVIRAIWEPSTHTRLRLDRRA